MLRTPALLLAALLPLELHAQADLVRAPDATPRAVLRSAGIGALDGTVRAVGPGYAVRFDAAGPTYLPAFGRAAPRDYPLHLAMRGVHRGGDLHSPAVRTTEHDEHRFVYDRGEIREVYEVRSDGVEQSFVFAGLPPGEGDLVVEILVDSELRAEPAADDSRIEFGHPDVAAIGSVVVGGVVGIDARGRTVRGSIRPTPRGFELALPAAFVSSASLPLILDPLIGTNFNVPSTSSQFDLAPDVAFDLDNDVFLVTWQYYFSSLSTDIRAQRVRRAGSLVGSLIPMSAPGVQGRPQVANVALSDAFLAVYAEGSEVLARSILAASGAVSAASTVASSNWIGSDPDVGGESTDDDNDAICVWASSGGDILARQVQVTSSGAISLVGSETTLLSSTTLASLQPAISKTGGTASRFVVVATRRESTTRQYVYGRAIDRQLGLLTGEALLSLIGGRTFASNPDVDGDGTNWIVAFDARPDLPATDRDVLATSVSFTPLVNLLRVNATAIAVEAGVDDDEWNPCVSWVGKGSCLIGYSDAVGSAAADAVVRSVDLFRCSPCEGQYLVTNGGGRFGNVAIASTLPHVRGGTEDALIVFDELDGAGSYSLHARRWSTSDGLFDETIGGGGCGSAGTPHASCARLGNSSFTLRLRDITPTPTVFCVLGFSTLGLACGPCRLIPDPYTGFVLATSGNGFAEITLPIPSDPGLRNLRVHTQWIVPTTSSAACATLGADLSSHLLFAIE